MTILHNLMMQLTRTITLSSLLVFSASVFSGPLKTVIDDFNHAQNNNMYQPRQFMNDSMLGGSTTTNHVVSNGIMRISGDITPPRGQPGWASSILPFGPMGANHDASIYKGIQLRIKLEKGNLTLSANSNEVTNFDFHSTPVTVPADGKFHIITLPFASMQRGWSEQTPLNTKTLNSVSIVAYSLRKASFAFEVDEISFY